MGLRSPGLSHNQRQHHRDRSSTSMQGREGACLLEPPPTRLLSASLSWPFLWRCTAPSSPSKGSQGGGQAPRRTRRPQTQPLRCLSQSSAWASRQSALQQNADVATGLAGTPAARRQGAQGQSCCSNSGRRHILVAPCCSPPVPFPRALVPSHAHSRRGLSSLWLSLCSRSPGRWSETLAVKCQTYCTRSSASHQPGTRLAPDGASVALLLWSPATGKYPRSARNWCVAGGVRVERPLGKGRLR